MTVKDTNRTLVALSVLLASTVVPFVVSEAIVRSRGYEPWRYLSIGNEPTMHEFDPVLGWKNKPGDYEVPPYSPSGKPIHITFLEGGHRRTHENQGHADDHRPKLIFVGGSYTQGWAISDPETHPWKIQQEFAAFEVLNYGTGGYGTLQSLLTLERQLPKTRDVRIVVSNLIEHDQFRNVAPSDWLETLSRFSARAHVYLPYATVGQDGTLVRHDPERYPSWFLREQLALVAMAERAFMNLRTRTRSRQGRSVTDKLLLEMQQLCARHGAALIVVILDGSAEFRGHYVTFLQREDIATCDCAYPLTVDMWVEGEGHPNGKMNSRWATCITECIRSSTPGPGAAKPGPA